MKAMKILAVLVLTLCARNVYTADTISVLFIGNSLSSEIPDPLTLMIQGAHTQIQIKYTSEFWGGSTLQYHWDSLRSKQLIQSGASQYVVIQESKQPSFFLQYDTATRNNIYRWGTTFVNAIHQAKSEAVVYCTMGFRGDTMPANDSLLAVETRVAVDNHAILAPIGAVARQALIDNPNLDLWSDGIHNNSLGVYLIACTFFCVFTGESPVGSTVYGSGTATVTPTQAQWAQNLAWQVMSTKYLQYLSWIKDRQTSVLPQRQSCRDLSTTSLKGAKVSRFFKEHYGVYLQDSRFGTCDIRGRVLRYMPKNVAGSNRISQ